MLATVLLRALGYVDEAANDYENNIQELATLTELNPIKDGELLRGEAFDAIWPHITLPVAKDGKTVMKDVIGKDAPAPAKLEVVSAKADQLQTVVITFNQPVDPAKLGDITILDAAGRPIDAFAPVVNGNTVTIKLDDVLANQKKYGIVIDNAVSLNGAELGKYEGEFVAFDNTWPTVTDVRFTGPKQITITFSEEIDGRLGKGVEVYEGKFPCAYQNLDIQKNKVIVDFYQPFKENTKYAIHVENFYDYAELYNIVYDVELPYAKDTEMPVATIVSHDQKSVQVEFSKPVTGLKPAYFYHTYENWNPVQILDANGKNIRETDTVSYVNVVFYNGAGKGLVPGETLFGIKGAGIKDLWGQAMADFQQKLAVNDDRVAPMVVDASVIKESGVYYLLVQFTKEVELLTKDTIEITNEDDKAVTIGSVIPYSPTVQLVVVPVKEKAKYTVVISGLKDKSVNGNKLVPFKKVVEVADMTPPQLVSTKAITITGDPTDKKVARITFYFDEELAPESASYKNFAFMKETSAGSGIFEEVYLKGRTTLGADLKHIVIETDNKDAKAEIFSAANTINPLIKTVKISGVKDYAGNSEIIIYDITKEGTTVLESDKTVGYIAKVIDEKTLEITFTEEVAEFPSDIFTSISIGGKSDFTVAGVDGNTVTLVVDGYVESNPSTHLPKYVTAGDQIVMAAKNIFVNRNLPVDTTATTLYDEKAITCLTEKVAPKYVDYSVVDAGVKEDVEINFSENMKLADGVLKAELSKGLVVSYAYVDGTLKDFPAAEYGTDYTIDLIDNKVVVSIPNKGHHDGTYEYLKVVIKKDAFKGLLVDNAGNAVEDAPKAEVTVGEGPDTSVSTKMKADSVAWDHNANAKISIQFTGALKPIDAALETEIKDAITGKIGSDEIGKGKTVEATAVAVTGDTLTITLNNRKPAVPGEELELNIPFDKILDIGNKPVIDVVNPIKLQKEGIALTASDIEFADDMSTAEAKYTFEATLASPTGQTEANIFASVKVTVDGTEVANGAKAIAVSGSDFNVSLDATKIPRGKEVVVTVGKLELLTDASDKAVSVKDDDKVITKTAPLVAVSDSPKPTSDWAENLTVTITFTGEIAISDLDEFKSGVKVEFVDKDNEANNEVIDHTKMTDADTTTSKVIKLVFDAGAFTKNGEAVTGDELLVTIPFDLIKDEDGNNVQASEIKITK